MLYRNLTSHVVRVRNDESAIAEPLDTDLVYPAPAPGEVPALRIKEQVVNEEIVDGVRIRTTKLSTIENLPDPEPGVMLIVSMPVAQVAYGLGRRDVVAPDSGKDAVRFKLPNGNEGTFAVRALRYIDAAK